MSTATGTSTTTGGTSARRPRRSRAAILGVALVVGALLGVSGCSATAGADASAETGSTPSPTPTAPAVPAYVADPVADALSAAATGLPAGLDGFASNEARDALTAALGQLDADRAAAVADPSSAPPSAAPGGWNQVIALDTSVVVAALDAARADVVGTVIRVLNEETTGADQAVRDTLYLAVVDQQAPAPSTADTPRLLTELIAKTRAAQESQAAYLAAEAERAAAEATAAENGGGSEQGPATGGGGLGHIEWTPRPVCLPPRIGPLGEYFPGGCSDPQ
jgi:hypothetical protein